MFKISTKVVDAFLRGAINSFPNEFFALLGSSTQSNLIDEFIIVPSFANSKEVLIQMHLIPIDFSIIGTMHSHPTKNNMPSKADLKTFKKLGEIHLIVGFPFKRETIKSFDSNGKELKFKEVKL